MWNDQETDIDLLESVAELGARGSGAALRTYSVAS